MKENNKCQWTYCNMSTIQGSSDFISTCAGVGGGWRRIVNINISAGDDCPGEWRKATQSGVCFCRVATDDVRRTCSSANFSTNGISYHNVCGKARGYQEGHTLGFFTASHNATIDYYYVGAISITYNKNPRQHIWTFASGSSEIRRNDGNCPCACSAGKSAPLFVTNNYYCETASLDAIDYNKFYFDDTLWDGAGCTGGTCCDDTTQSWFYRQLNQTTQDNIEVRICTYDQYKYGSTVIDQLELYIQ